MNKQNKIKQISWTRPIFNIFLFLNIYINISGNFYESFIQSYDLSGRYTHEYHPFILNKTRNSFIELEQYLKNAKFSVDGRMIIIGYQEEAIAPYKTKWSREAIEDEAIVKTSRGIAKPVKNIFGFMTGFLLKDAQWLENYWRKKGVTPVKDKSEPKILHIVEHPIDLFADDAIIFQKHAFGKDFNFLIKVRDKIERAISKQDLKITLEELIGFWSQLYEKASTTGSQEIVSTQDVLFSIDYARALLQGQTSLDKLFVGPDITYPIELLNCQKINATVHAQKFINIFTQNVKPVDNKNTAYIFCSYVDGVGKSTLLNNIKNYQKYGNNFSKYERCDNSSSQLATIYELKEKVFLVDLPAQISHFVFKPDGLVFVNIDTVKEVDITLKNKILSYIKKNKQEITAEFENLKNKVASQNHALYQSENIIEQYALNCITLQIQTQKWLPFKFEDNYYLFDLNSEEELRALVPLAEAHSTGLKNVEPEQMLFSNGISLPMKYSYFLEDLKEKLANNNIEHVKFVDFLSMYPRSSRENIRVNFVLQYLKKIFGSKYDFNDTFYQHSIYREQEICHLLYNRIDAAVKALALETILRWSLYNLLDKVPSDALSSIKGEALESLLKEQIALLSDTSFLTVKKAIENRLNPERTVYYQNYGLDKTYENLVRFSAEPIAAFSKVLNTVCSTYLKNSYLNSLWAGMDGNLCDIQKTHKAKLKSASNNTNVDVTIRFKVSGKCREEESLKKMIRCIRAQWYATLSNMLHAYLINNEYKIEKMQHYVPPLAVKLEPDGYLYVLQKHLPAYEPKKDGTEERLLPPIKFHLIDLMKTCKWGEFAKVAHCMEWDNLGTFFGIYAYGYYPLKSPKTVIAEIFDEFRQRCFSDNKSTFMLPVSELYNQIIKKNAWEKIKQEVSSGQTKIETIAQNDPRIPAIKLWLRMVATLEMILKDTQTEIVVRKGNKEDFIACLKILQTFTLPQFFNIQIPFPLFEDYHKVEPVISWQIINQI